MLLLGALSTDPVLLPLTMDPSVGDHHVRLSARGEAGTLDDLGGIFEVEGMFLSRMAVSATVGLEEEFPVVGAEVRGELLEEATTRPGLGIAGRCKKIGFDSDKAEVEFTVSASRHLGPFRLVANLTGGKEVEEPAGDLEVALSAVHPLGSVFSLGLDARGRWGLGEEEEREEEREYDALAGAVLLAGADHLSGYLFAGGQVVGRKEHALPGAVASLGIQAAF